MYFHFTACHNLSATKLAQEEMFALLFLQYASHPAEYVHWLLHTSSPQSILIFARLASNTKEGQEYRLGMKMAFLHIIQSGSRKQRISFSLVPSCLFIQKSRGSSVILAEEMGLQATCHVYRTISRTHQLSTFYRCYQPSQLM